MKSNTAVTETQDKGIENKFDSVKNNVADKIDKAAQVIHQTSDSAPARTKNGAEAVAEFGHKTADKVNSYAKQAADKASEYGHQTADMLETSAEYVRNIEPQKIKDAMQQKFYDHPGTSLLIAGATGFIVGALIARRF